LQRSTIVTEVVIYETKIVSGRSLQDAIRQVTSDGNCRVVILHRLLVVAHFAMQQAKMAQSLPLFQAITDGALHRQRPLQEILSFGKVAKLLVAITNQSGSDSLALLITILMKLRERFFEFRQRNFGTFARIEFLRARQEIVRAELWFAIGRRRRRGCVGLTSGCSPGPKQATCEE